MNSNNKQAFIDGLKTGIPIGLGYFAVSFSLGIMARKVGLSSIQGFFSSLTTLASAGEFAGFEAIGNKVGYIAIILITLVINIRYLLLGSSLTQKLNPNMKKYHKLGIAFFITDEIFAVSIARKGMLNPYFSYGNGLVAAPLWATGTMLGIVFGNLLPNNIVNAFSVALFGMFLAIIIPKGKDNNVIQNLILFSFILSGTFTYTPVLNLIPSSVRIILLTVAISLVAALLFPVKEGAINE